MCRTSSSLSLEPLKIFLSSVDLETYKRRTKRERPLTWILKTLNKLQLLQLKDSSFFVLWLSRIFFQTLSVHGYLCTEYMRVIYVEEVGNVGVLSKSRPRNIAGFFQNRNISTFLMGPMILPPHKIHVEICQCKMQNRCLYAFLSIFQI